MKKIFIALIMFFFIATASVFADNMPNLKYKNIKNNEKISYNLETGVWSKKIDKKQGNYFIKTKGFGDFYDYLNQNKDFAFSTNCEYEFIYNDQLIGYSNTDMKFYDITYINGGLNKRALSKDEVEKIFPEYRVITFNEFSPLTNSLKIKKHIPDIKIILYNNTNRTFDNYTYTSGNAKFEKYDLRGFLTISTPGMIQFSRVKENDNKNWYVLMIR